MMESLRENLGFSWRGMVVFFLPMLPNLLFFLGKGPQMQTAAGHPVWLDVVEHGSQGIFAGLLLFQVSERPSPLLTKNTFMAAGSLLAYYGLWAVYFTGAASFPVLLLMALLPVLYFIAAGSWLHNRSAVVFTAVFGAAHLLITWMDFHPF